jgi:hypothetical protein
MSSTSTGPIGLGRTAMRCSKLYHWSSEECELIGGGIMPSTWPFDGAGGSMDQPFLN